MNIVEADFFKVFHDNIKHAISGVNDKRIRIKAKTLEDKPGQPHQKYCCFPVIERSNKTFSDKGK